MSTSTQFFSRWSAGIGRSVMIAGCFLLAAALHAQTSAPVGDGRQPPSGLEEDAGASDERGPRGGPVGIGPGFRHMQRWSQGLLRAGPEDQGPLQPGEADELMTFCCAHAPRIYGVLDTLRRRDAGKFERKLAEYAPRLRHLRRIWEHSPRVGAAVQACAQNGVETEQVRRALAQSPPASAEHESAMQSLRDLVAAGVRLEADALEAVATDLDERQAERVEERLTQLTADGADLAPWPVRVRELLLRYRSAQTEEERGALRAKLQAVATRQITTETGMHRERAAQIRARAAELVDERVGRMLDGRPPRKERDRR